MTDEQRASAVFARMTMELLFPGSVAALARTGIAVI